MFKNSEDSQILKKNINVSSKTTDILNQNISFYIKNSQDSSINEPEQILIHNNYENNQQKESQFNQKNVEQSTKLKDIIAPKDVSFLISDNRLHNVSHQKPNELCNSFDVENTFKYRKEEIQSDTTTRNDHKGFIQKSLMKFKYIKQRTIYFISNHTSIGRVRYLQKLQIRDTINDISDGVLIKKNEKLLFKLIKAIRFLISIKMLERIKLIDPHSNKHFYMLILFTLYNICFLVYFSVVSIFHNLSTTENVTNLMSILIWVFEIFTKINTKIYVGTKLIDDRFQIIDSYLKNKFLYDFIPLILLISLPQPSIERFICEFLVFLKIKNVAKDKNKIQQRFCISVQNYHIVQLINLIAKLFIIGHIIACAWYLIGQVEIHLLGYESTWYELGFGADHIWWKLYLEAFYWALSLLTTGSNTANTLPQMFFTTFIMLFTTIMFGYIMNIIGTIIYQLEQEDENKRYDLNVINDYIRTNNISSNLQARINIDLENFYKKSAGKEQEGKKIIQQKISPHLQQSLKIEQAQQFLFKLGLIQQKFSQQVLEELADHIEEEYFLLNQIIYKENQEADISVMLVIQGSISLTQCLANDQKTYKTVRQVKKGEIFGLLNFFSGQPYRMSARSSDLTKVLKLNRQKFIELIQFREKDYQVFSQIKEKLTLYKDYFIIDKICDYCQQCSHLESECHFLHINKDFLYYKSKFYEKSNQTRQIHSRKNKWLNTYQIQNQVEQCVFYYQSNEEQQQDSLESQVEIQNNETQMKSGASISMCTSIQYQFEQQKNPEKQEQTSHTVKSFKNIAQSFRKNSKQFQKSNITQEVIKEEQEQKYEKNAYQNFAISEQFSDRSQSSYESPKNIKQDFQLIGISQHSLEEFKDGQNFEKKLPIQDNLNENGITKQKIPRISLIRRISKETVADSPTRKNNNILEICNIRRMTKDTQMDSPTRKNNNILEMCNIRRMTKDTQMDSPTKKNNYNTNFGFSNLINLQNIQAQQLDESFVKKPNKYNDWDFDSLKDWKYYFPYGNSKAVLNKFQKFIKKRIQQQMVKRRRAYTQNIQFIYLS